MAIRGMTLRRAQKYLQDVIEHKAAVPFRRYKGGVSRHAQGILCFKFFFFGVVIMRRGSGVSMRMDCEIFRVFLGNPRIHKGNGSQQCRWPKKSCEFLLNLLKNAESNAEVS